MSRSPMFRKNIHMADFNATPSWTSPVVVIDRQKSNLLTILRQDVVPIATDLGTPTNFRVQDIQDGAFFDILTRYRHASVVMELWTLSRRGSVD